MNETYLLNDEQMRYFIVNGYISVKTDMPASVHDAIFQQTETVFETEGNPGNNLLPRIPEIQQVFDNPTVKGALDSVLGSDCYMQPHRYPHDNPPRGKGKNLHQDGGKHWSHLNRRLLAFYYPQDTPLELGPTGVIPGSHYYSTLDGAKRNKNIPICAEAGTVTIANNDLWHGSMPNRTEKNRYMMKFVFARMSEPQSPSWDSKQVEWGEGRPIGNDKHQRMFERVWNWHCGKTNGDLAKGYSTDKDSLSDLIKGLENNSEPTALSVAYALSEFAEAIIPVLMEKLQEASEMVRRNAFYALTAIGAPAVDALISVLDHPDWQVRDCAVKALADIGLSAQSCVPALIGVLQDESEQVRAHAAEALGITAQQESTAVPALILALQDENDQVRRNATFALAQIGPYAKAAVDALQSVFSDESRYVRGVAVHALHCIGTPEAQEILFRFLIKSRWCPLTSAKNTY